MKKKHKIILVIGLALSTILALLASLLAFSAKWMFKTWTNLTMDELVYHLTAPLEGTNTDMIKDYCNECAVPAILILGCILFAIAANRKHAGILKKIAIVCSAGAVAVTGITVGVTWSGLDISNYMKGQSTYSTFIDDNYVDPSSVNITFPEQKRNLIYIFLESMEMTYADKENGGASSARNSGIDTACGEYIIFLDSDDYWEGNYTLQRLAEKSKDGYDIIMFGCKLLNMKNGKMRLSRNGYNIALLENSKREEALQYLLKSKDIPGAAYIFATKKSVLNGSERIRFVTGISGEDYDFVLSCFFEAQSYSAIDDVFYIYRRGQSNSVTSTSAELIIKGSLYAIKKWRAKAGELRCKPLAADLLNYLAFIYCTALLLAGGLKGEKKKQAFEQLSKESDILAYGFWKKVKLVRAARKIIGAEAAAKLLNIYWKFFGK